MSTNNTPTNNHSCYSHLSDAEFITKFEHITDPIFMEALARLVAATGTSVCAGCDNFLCDLPCIFNSEVYTDV